jgi:hypothetical protein
MMQILDVYESAIASVVGQALPFALIRAKA